MIKKEKINEAPLNKKDFMWLLGAIVAGGIIAPIILLSGLKITPASTASLLLNFEGVATTIIAIVFFKKSIFYRANKRYYISGSFSFILSIILKNKIPDLKIIVIAMVIGFFCYVLSIVLYVFAMRELGSARTSALYGSEPFVGSILSFILLGDVPSNMLFIAVPIMLSVAIFY